MILLAGIAITYILGSIITSITLGYRGYESGFANDYPPAPMVVVFWPIALLVFGYLKLYALGSSLKEAREIRERAARETQNTTQRPTYLGPPPK